MTYLESAEGQTLTRQQALRVVLLHQTDVFEFLAEVGDKLEYDATEVLEWLGY